MITLTWIQSLYSIRSFRNGRLWCHLLWAIHGGDWRPAAIPRDSWHTWVSLQAPNLRNCVACPRTPPAGCSPWRSVCNGTWHRSVGRWHTSNGQWVCRTTFRRQESRYCTRVKQPTGRSADHSSIAGGVLSAKVRETRKTVNARRVHTGARRVHTQTDQQTYTHGSVHSRSGREKIPFIFLISNK